MNEFALFAEVHQLTLQYDTAVDKSPGLDPVQTMKSNKLKIYKNRWPNHQG